MKSFMSLFAVCWLMVAAIPTTDANRRLRTIADTPAAAKNVSPLPTPTPCRTQTTLTPCPTPAATKLPIGDSMVAGKAIQTPTPSPSFRKSTSVSFHDATIVIDADDFPNGEVNNNYPLYDTDGAASDPSETHHKYNRPDQIPLPLHDSDNVNRPDQIPVVVVSEPFNKPDQTPPPLYDSDVAARDPSEIHNKYNRPDQTPPPLYDSDVAARDPSEIPQHQDSLTR